MIGPGYGRGSLLACAIGLATTLGFVDAAGAAVWSHPVLPGPSKVTVVPLTGSSANVSDTQTSGNLTASGSGVSASSVTSTATTRSDGSVSTTVTTVYLSPVNIKISGKYQINGASLTFSATLASMTSGPVTVAVTGGGNDITAVVTPNSTAGTVNVNLIMSPYSNSLASVTLNLSPPASTSTNSYSSPPGSGNGSTGPVPALTPARPLTGGSVEADAASAAALAEADIQRCGLETPSCVADALDAYATKLERMGAALPTRLSALPVILHRTAARVRVARTKSEAVGAVKAAIVQIRHTVELLRADDPDTLALGRKVGGEAIDVLRTASHKLEVASDL